MQTSLVAKSLMIAQKFKVNHMRTELVALIAMAMVGQTNRMLSLMMHQNMLNQEHLPRQ